MEINVEYLKVKEFDTAFDRIGIAYWCLFY